MTMRGWAAGTLAMSALALVDATPAAAAQGLAVPDPVLEGIWTEAMENSEIEPMAQVLLDAIGPRLTGSPHMERAQEWAVSMLSGWGVEARTEEYGIVDRNVAAATKLGAVVTPTLLINDLKVLGYTDRDTLTKYVRAAIGSGSLPR